MRLTPEQTRAIVAATHELAGPDASVRLFGSRLQRLLGDRRIDVLLIDPDTPLEPVHRVAPSEGWVLQP